jgi:FkbM family methyltransferase
MKFTSTFDDGAPVEFECEDNIVSRWVCDSILRGETYPNLPFLDDVRVVVDVGANCGATTVYLAHHHPDAVIHCFEPARLPRTHLEHNVGDMAQVHVHAFGLHNRDDHVDLHVGIGSGMSSVVHRPDTESQIERIQVRSAERWSREQGIDAIDILKVDVEGLEPQVLGSLSHLLPTVKACYLEYDSRQDRREIAALFAPTHELYVGMMFLDQGECIYLRKDIADQPEATAHLARILGDRAARQAARDQGASTAEA